jgi:glucose-1-phosphate adenylyltransferase
VDSQPDPVVDPADVVAVVLGGGRGTRLFPLTKMRAKPAVSFGGKYRLIDIPLTNCIRSRVPRVFILTQFNSYSLNRHIWQTYSRQAPRDSFIDVIAAEQTAEHGEWFQGTADAVRQSLSHIVYHKPRYILIISGDQIYSMDYADMLRCHVENRAQITIAAHCTPADEVHRFGVMHLDAERRVRDFCEKPESPDQVAEFRVTPELLPSVPPQRPFLCSMGIYLFDAEVLAEALQCSQTDFGHGIIPRTAPSHRMFAYPFDGYWEDVGTIETFYQANMLWREGKGIAEMFEHGDAIITHSRQLRPATIDTGCVEASLVADGCDVHARELRRSIVGVRSRIGPGTVIEDAIVMGNDAYLAGVDFEIGPDCRIRRAIIDKNVVLGPGCRVGENPDAPDTDHELYSIRSGIVIIPRETVIPPGTVI